MKYFGTQTNYLLDIIKPYQRPELRHAGPTSVNREAELACRAIAQRRRKRPSRVACSDLLGVFMSAYSTLAPCNDPQNDGNDEKSCWNKIKCPARYLYPIYAHATENYDGVAAGLDDR